ncbi:MAG: hypothetical protein RR942_12325 [Romboutsia sp.]
MNLNILLGIGISLIIGMFIVIFTTIKLFKYLDNLEDKHKK